ncbi:hypothetical protein BH10PSE19_BH10PSE19_01270 [soil metagenome]
MSFYRVCKNKSGQNETVEYKKFDNKEDAEHFAKNQSLADDKHSYEIQKNESGDFKKIKEYLKGMVCE